MGCFVSTHRVRPGRYVFAAKYLAYEAIVGGVVALVFPGSGHPKVVEPHHYRGHYFIPLFGLSTFYCMGQKSLTEGRIPVRT